MALPLFVLLELVALPDVDDCVVELLILMFELLVEPELPFTVTLVVLEFPF